MNKFDRIIEKAAMIAGFIAAAYVIVDGAARVVSKTKDILKNRKLKKQEKTAAAAA
ncbi:MAG: hypothetical protein ACE14M_01285 [Terriglobales bacterium]